MVHPLKGADSFPVRSPQSEEEKISKTVYEEYIKESFEYSFKLR